MSGGLIQMSLVNAKALIDGIAEAKKLQLRYSRTEMKRGLQRIRKMFIKEQLQGPPGIKAGNLAKGKNIWTYATGETAKDVSGKIGISRILHVHEKGLTISGKGASGLLYIHAKGSGPRKSRPIVAVVPQVTIPKRLHFRDLVHREAPAQLTKVGEASQRGIEVALSRALKKSV